MKAYELPVRITSEGKLELPECALPILPTDRPVRVIILVTEPTDEEEADWSRLTTEQFFAGYSPDDAIYDKA